MAQKSTPIHGGSLAGACLSYLARDYDERETGDQLKESIRPSLTVVPASVFLQWVHRLNGCSKDELKILIWDQSEHTSGNSAKRVPLTLEVPSARAKVMGPVMGHNTGDAVKGRRTNICRGPKKPDDRYQYPPFPEHAASPRQ